MIKTNTSCAFPKFDVCGYTYYTKYDTDYGSIGLTYSIEEDSSGNISKIILASWSQEFSRIQSK